jgi:uncharacterized protein YlxW (UPF0749 family)
MTTAHLLIVCGTLLAAVALVARQGRAWASERAQHQRELAMHERATAAPVADLAKVVEALDQRLYREHRVVDELAEAVDVLVATGAKLIATVEERGPSRVGMRVTIHTKQPDDQSLHGVVMGDYTDRICLEDASYLIPGGMRPLPGRQDIDRRDIAWIDVHGHVAPVPATAPEGAPA